MSHEDVCRIWNVLCRPCACMTVPPAARSPRLSPTYHPLYLPVAARFSTLALALLAYQIDIYTCSAIFYNSSLHKRAARRHKRHKRRRAAATAGDDHAINVYSRMFSARTSCPCIPSYRRRRAGRAISRASPAFSVYVCCAVSAFSQLYRPPFLFVLPPFLPPRAHAGASFSCCVPPISPFT